MAGSNEFLYYDHSFSSLIPFQRLTITLLAFMLDIRRPPPLLDACSMLGDAKGAINPDVFVLLVSRAALPRFLLAPSLDLIFYLTVLVMLVVLAIHVC